MRGPYRAIGLDFDGTLTEGGRPDEEVLAALRETRRAGHRLVLVTGRILAELRSVFPDVDSFFDALVVENGALLVHGASFRRLATPPSLELDERLLHAGVRFRRGQVLLASTLEFAGVVLREVGRLGLELQIVQNRGEIMLVPSGVSKGTGLAAALSGLGVSPHDAVGIGDAENDHTLLEVCELGVAVANAVPSLRASADVVTVEPAGRGVVSFLDGPVFRGEARILPARRRVEIGRFEDGSPVRLPAARTNLLFEGPTLSGKSYAVGLFVEGLLALGYSVCVIDPEGDHTGIGTLHACMVVGGHDPLAAPERIAGFFSPTFGSLVVDLSQVPRSERSGWSVRMLTALRMERARTGFPHWIVVDEAHLPFTAEPGGGLDFERGERGYCLITYQPERLGAGVRTAMEYVVSTEGEGRARLRGPDLPPEGRSFVLGERLTQHVRHRHKYAHQGLPDEQRFVFRAGDDRTGRSAGSLEELHRQLSAEPLAVLRHHAAGQDLSRWVADALRDASLAKEIRRLESSLASDAEDARVAEVREAILAAIERRYLA